MLWRSVRRPSIRITLDQLEQILALVPADSQQEEAVKKQSQQLADTRERLEQTESEPGRFRKWIESWRRPKLTPEEFAAENRDWWFKQYLPSVEGAWNQRIDNYLKLHPKVTREEAEEKSAPCVLDQAQKEYDKLERELDKGLQRSNVITGSAAMVAALILGLVTIVITQKISFNVPILLGATGFMMLSFVLNLWSMRPPFKRAITEPYVDIAAWSVLTVDTFTTWAALCYSCRSRQRIATRYKVLHSISITLFAVGVMLLGPAFSWSPVVAFLASLF